MHLSRNITPQQKGQSKTQQRRQRRDQQEAGEDSQESGTEINRAQQIPACVLDPLVGSVDKTAVLEAPVIPWFRG